MHDYYYIQDKYNHLNKLMMTFTYQDNNKYFKMQVINEIKNYISKLIRNTKNENIKYFANIELGKEYDNPHLHIQFWYDDLRQLQNIRNKVIDKFNLNSEYCHVTIPNDINKKYDYVIKDYSKSISDSDLLLLDSVKRDYRFTLNKNIRFTSMSKEKYTKSTYKKAYSHGILKKNVDTLLDNFIINKEIEIIDNKVIECFMIIMILRHLVQCNRINKGVYHVEYKKSQIIQLRFLYLYWIFGFS